jgi:hypothetical protein
VRRFGGRPDIVDPERPPARWRVGGGIPA